MIQFIAKTRERVIAMSNKFLFSLAMTGLLVATAGADDTITTVESTNLLFSVTAASANIPVTDTEPWDIPTSGTASRTGTTIDVDTAASDPLKYAGTFSGATRYRVTGKMTVTLNAAVPADTVFGVTSPKAALVAVAGDTNKWYGWDGDSWEDLSSGITTPPVEDAQYNVAIEFFVVDSNLNIKYTVGSLSQTLEHSSDTELPGAFSVGLAGYGSFGDFAALGFKEYEVTIPAESLEAACKAMGITDGVTADKLNALGENGLTKWESIVLGLESPSTKPYTAPVQTSGNTLGFTIGNVDTDKYGATGATVTFDVYEYDIGEQTLGDKVTATSVAAGSTAEVTAPSGVKYYKIKIKITESEQ